MNPTRKLPFRIDDVLDNDPVIDVFEDFSVATRFVASREEAQVPTWDELLRCDAEDDDEIEAPEAMTGNDAFRIIEIIKEREAARRRG